MWSPQTSEQSMQIHTESVWSLYGTHRGQVKRPPVPIPIPVQVCETHADPKSAQTLL